MADTSAIDIAHELEQTIGNVPSERARVAMRKAITRLRELQRINADLRIRNAMLEVAVALEGIEISVVDGRPPMVDRDAN